MCYTIVSSGYSEPRLDLLCVRTDPLRSFLSRSLLPNKGVLLPLQIICATLMGQYQTAVAHSIDFPIDADHSTPPALDVLITTCYPMDEGGTLVYPPTLPLTITLELSDHPIMDAIRSTLLPLLPSGHYLTAMRDKLQIIGNGACLTMAELLQFTSPSQFASVAVHCSSGTLMAARSVIQVEVGGVLILSRPSFWPTASTRWKPFTTGTS
jgi:hypothetical protein